MGEDTRSARIRTATSGFLASAMRNAAHYKVVCKSTTTTVVNVFDKTVISAKGQATSWVRFDNPHPGANYPHINVNYKISGVRDPHTKISKLHLKAIGVTGKALQKLNEAAPLLTAAAVTADAYRISKAATEDFSNGTTRNTVSEVATVAGTWAGGYAAASW
ncbi:unnamed protein product [Caenorhabditis auriculariae]|uniref:Uncharacterized protein n=1 Tax=Caenorhabditis auriculariae TaxID=2777116 RepID=A0A8S1HSP0_9PELO|nr:unnamed protein product [Caenorhabditis auriculariae]